MFETAPIGILVIDAETGVIQDANRCVTELLGCAADDLVGRPLWSAAAFRNAAATRHCFRDLLCQATVRYDDLPLETAAGEIRRVELVSTLYLADAHPFVQCAMRDVTERVKEAEEEQEARDDLAAQISALREADPGTRDALTGLLTPSHLDESLGRELHRARRGNGVLTVAVLGVDGFDRITAAFGRDAADALLREAGRVLREQLRKSDLACRYPRGGSGERARRSGESGAEFGIVLPQSSPRATLERLEAIRRAVHSLELRHDARLLDPVTVSAGVVSAQPHHTASALLEAARAALAAARRAGGDRVVGATIEEIEPHALRS